MDISINSETKPPEPLELNPLLDAYYEAGVAQLVEAGGPDLDPTPFKLDFWDNIADFLPPSGRFFLARNDKGQLMGYGSLKTVAPGIGEMKRLYVRPEARGHSIGRQLIEFRIEAAREMGLKILKADTWQNNTPMLKLYESLGFTYIDVFPDSATYKLMPHVAPYMVFLELSLEQ